MRRLGIIQPGRLGDIIICLPIAKWYADKGYEVVWPVEHSYIPNFLGYVDYVNFIGIDSLDCNTARNECLHLCNTVLDLSISFPNSHPYNDSVFYQRRHEMSFDRIKYSIANVSFEEKWNLKFNRNLNAEHKLEGQLNIPDSFTLVHTRGSSEAFTYHPEDGESVIYVNDSSPSIFDWCNVIKKANKIVAIDSSFANLVEQYGFAGPKFLVRRAADVRPMYKDWIVL
jgi:hypothetical protein